MSNHLYNRQVEQFLHEKTSAAKRAITQLTGEKDDYRALFNKLTVQMDEDAKDGKITQEESGGFHQLAQRLMEGWLSMQDLLEEKEFQLWEKEGLLEYQEERLMNTEDLEMEMAAYINEMAANCMLKGARPLSPRPWVWRTARGGGAKKEEERRG